MAKLQTKPEPKSQLERIAEIYPLYSSLLQKHSELLARQEAVYAEAAPLAERGKLVQAPWQAQAPKPKPVKIVRNAAAVALIGDDLLSPQPEAELNPPPPPTSWPGEQRLRELTAESEVIVEALKMLGQELTKARKQYSLMVAKERSSEHAALVDAVVDMARGLGTAIQSYYEFLNEQRLDAVSWKYFGPLNLEAFGNINEVDQPLLKLITQAIELNHVGGGKLTQWKMPADIALFQVGN